MTALNVVCLADSVHLVSDGAACDGDGRLAALFHKVTPLPHLNLAIGVRGVRAAAIMAVDTISVGATSYDDLRSRVAKILKDYLGPVAPAWEKQLGQDALKFEVVVAGWSESRGPAAFVMATSDLNDAHGLPAWTPVDVPGAYFSPSNEQLSADFARIQLSFDDATAVELVRRQRAMDRVGSFVQLTTVRREGIETRILKRWPDVIGKTIKPN
jgi:hypothetical protein